MSRIDSWHWKISSGHHFQNGHLTNSTLSDFNDISYVGRLWCPKFIPDVEKFLEVAIFKMATTIPQKFSTLFDFKGSFWFFFNLLSVAGLGDLRLHNR